MKRIFLILGIGVGIGVAVALASTPQLKDYQSQSDFEKGTAKGTSVTSRGEIQLAPKLEPLYESGAPFLWSVTRDSKGAIYVAGGNDGKVYRVDANGRGQVYFEAPEVEIYALAVDRSDRLLVATSPEGKIYRVSRSGADPQESIFFDPDDLYIWSLVHDSQGNLLVGTGDQGKIYKVDPQGNGEILYDSEEAHIRALALDAKGNLFAGTATNGILYRIGMDGNVFVLYDSPMQELHAVQVAKSGDVYVAGLGQTLIRPRAPQPADVPVTLQAPVAVQGQERETDLGAQQVMASQAPSPSLRPGGQRIESALYRVQPDGTVRNLWQLRTDRLHSLAIDADGSVLAGTGDRGRVYRISRDGERMLLFELDQAQVTVMTAEPGGSFLLATSNLGHLYRLGKAFRSQGTYLSEVLDTKVVSRWGALNWQAEIPRGTKIELSTRSGNAEKPDKTWSDWSPAYSRSGEVISSPSARFIQWRASLFTEASGVTPVLDRVTLAYLQRNVAPQLTSVEVTQAPSPTRERSTTARAIATGRTSSQGENSSNGSSATLGRKRPKSDKLTITWEAEDDNGDDLAFDLFYRGDDETVWKPLVEDHKGKSYTLDPELLPDGRYVIKVVAKDEPSNPPSLALKDERVSEPFIVDNSGPAVQNLRIDKRGSEYQVRFLVSDALSPVSVVEYTVDVEGWKLVYPEDGIADSKRETFAFQIDDPGPGRHTLVIRAEDNLGNVGYGKATFP